MKTLITFLLLSAVGFSQTEISLLKKQSTFSFDSLSLSDNSGAQKRLFKAGRVYQFSVIKKPEYFFYSEESSDITLFDDLVFKTIPPSEVARHNPGVEVTDPKLIAALMAISSGQEFTIKIKVIPSVYNHINKKGVKCGHDYQANLCKLISVK